MYRNNRMEKMAEIEKVIRVMVEAATDELCDKYVMQVVDVMEAEGLIVG